MVDKKPGGSEATRKARLAEELRANLARRKGQARARREGAADQRPDGLGVGRPEVAQKTSGMDAQEAVSEEPGTVQLETDKLVS